MQRRNNYNRRSNRRSRYRNNNRRRHQQSQDHYAQKRRYQQRWKKKVTKFEIGAYVCIKKQREGVGIVDRISNTTANSYRIAFKNGARAYYRHNKISLISADEYFGASADFIIDKTLPSPSPTPIPQYRDVFYSPSPSPSPMPNAEDMGDIQLQADSQQIRFKEPMEVKGNDEILLNEEVQNQKMQIKVDDSPQDTRVPEPKQAIEDEKAEKNEKDEQNERDERKEKDQKDEQDQKNEKDQKNELVVDKDEIILMEEEKSDIAEVDAVQTYQFNDDVKEHKKDVSKVMKKKEQLKLSKFEKKKKLYYKVKDAREREFLVMCDENRMIDLKALHEYIEYFGEKKTSRNSVGHFLKWMQPNARGFVSFSKFVKAIEDDGDVVKAWVRFRKYGNPKPRKTRRVLLAAKRKILSK